MEGGEEERDMEREEVGEREGSLEEPSQPVKEFRISLRSNRQLLEL